MKRSVVLSSNETTLIGRVSDIVQNGASGSNFVILKEWGSGVGYVV
jgi:hypothetical protein